MSPVSGKSSCYEIWTTESFSAGGGGFGVLGGFGVVTSHLSARRQGAAPRGHHPREGRAGRRCEDVEAVKSAPLPRYLARNRSRVLQMPAPRRTESPPPSSSLIDDGLPTQWARTAISRMSAPFQNVANPSLVADHPVHHSRYASTSSPLGAKDLCWRNQEYAPNRRYASCRETSGPGSCN